MIVVGSLRGICQLYVIESENYRKTFRNDGQIIRGVLVKIMC